MMETSSELPLLQLSEGMNLPEIKRTITQQKINLYAEASGDFNPIHVDEDFAQQTPLGGTIAHGMLILAYVSQMMAAAFGRSWLVGGKLNVRFKNPARKGDIITVSGKVDKIKKNRTRILINCDVLCQNQNGEPVIIGEASLGMKRAVDATGDD
jgi:3-hydroxybutyryl-CoA dehydratase